MSKKILIRRSEISSRNNKVNGWMELVLQVSFHALMPLVFLQE